MDADVELSALREASATGDLAAQTSLALRLLKGTHDRAEGMALLKTAAERGNGEALSLMATFVAGGVIQEPDWNVALEYLAAAAEAGLSSARAELRLLAQDESEQNWQALAKRAQVQRWLSPPGPRVLINAPRIAVIEQFLWPEACDWFISLGAGKLKAASIYDNEKRGSRQSEHRTNSDYSFDLFNARISSCLLQTRIEAAIGAPVENFESMTLMHYAPGEEFTPHCDYLDPRTPGTAEDIRQRGQRILTFLVYLNDDYAGGETEFPMLDFSFRGKRGDALVFANVHAGGAPDPKTTHAGRPPTSGAKWILSQWIRNRPQHW